MTIIDQAEITEQQLESIHQSLAEKKDYVGYQVEKSLSAFSRVHKFYNIFAKVKTVILVLYSIYHFFGGTENSSFLPIILSLIMTFIMFKKSIIAKRAIKTKTHAKSLKFFKKTLILGAIFAVVFTLWSVTMMKSMQQTQQDYKVDSEFVKEGMKTINSRNSPKLPDFTHMRIGSPAAFNKHHERRMKHHEKQEEQRVRTEVNEMTAKQLDDQRIQEEFGEIFELPKDIILIYIFSFLTLILAVKFIIFYVHFMRFNNALEKQDKIEKMILHFKHSKPSAPVKIEEEKCVPEQVLSSPDIPIINDETITVPTKSNFINSEYLNLCSNSTQIIDMSCEGSYPVISPPPASMMMPAQGQI
jgi:hypothetical protein